MRESNRYDKEHKNGHRQQTSHMPQSDRQEHGVQLTKEHSHTTPSKRVQQPSVTLLAGYQC